ncbi:MAG: type IV pilus assembly protein PilW [Planctomycetota bacterium]|jgi:type IV pilus assembly protein PilW
MIMDLYKSNQQSGVTLVELLVAISIGAFMMLGLTTTFQNSSRAQRALVKSNELIENGRYAISILYEDLRHAGYYGHFYNLGNPLANLPDPCEIGNLASLRASMAIPVQSYTSADLATAAVIASTPNTCAGTWLTAANLAVGSDILVIRRADTAVFTGTPNPGEVYLQSNVLNANLLEGNISATVPPTSPVPTVGAPGLAADNTTTNLLKYPSKTGDATIAETRSFHVHVYFVAPCSFGSGANGICAGGDDAIPTLKRLELGSDGSDPTMNIVPLVEGIEFMKLEYGIDSTPTTTNPVTGLQGDGIPDFYVPSASTTQLPMAVSFRIHLLVRATEEASGHADTKQYVLPPVPAAPTVPILTTATGDKFKRHIFTTEVRPMNLSGRREIPE